MKSVIWLASVCVLYPIVVAGVGKVCKTQFEFPPGDFMVKCSSPRATPGDQLEVDIFAKELYAGPLRLIVGYAQVGFTFVKDYKRREQVILKKTTLTNGQGRVFVGIKELQALALSSTGHANPVVYVIVYVVEEASGRHVTTHMKGRIKELEPKLSPFTNFCFELAMMTANIHLFTNTGAV